MDLYLEERRQEILDWIKKQGRASVSELSQRYGVSEVTIRTDLQALENQNAIIRTHGGAIYSGVDSNDLALVKRLTRHIEEKSRIGEAGAAMISTGDTVFLDSSSTTLAIAQKLKHHQELTVITNSLTVAQTFLEAVGVTVVLIGGVLQRYTASIIGNPGIELLQNFTIQKGFFGAHGISIPEGLTDISQAEAEVKRSVVALCRQVIAVVDASKWGRVGFSSFAEPDQIHTVLSDTNAPEEFVEPFRALGIEVIEV